MHVSLDNQKISLIESKYCNTSPISIDQYQYVTDTRNVPYYNQIYVELTKKLGWTLANQVTFVYAKVGLPAIIFRFKVDTKIIDITI